MSSSKVMELPPGIIFVHIKGAGTSGLVAAWPGQTAIKIPQGEPDDIVRCQKEGDVYERFQSAKRRPQSLLEYRGRTKDGILLEYAERGSIREYSRNANLSPSTARVLRWAEQAAEALVFIHANGVLHGDISCTNYEVGGRSVVRSKWPERAVRR